MFCPTKDYFGTSRPYPPVSFPDIGAVENALGTPWPNAIEDSKLNKTPKAYRLSQNYPNPFNPRTVISWQLAVSSDVDLSVYNLLGQKIATLVSGKQRAGFYKVEWDASDFAIGVYYYRLQAGEFVDSLEYLW